MWASHFVRNGNKLSISSWLTTEVQVCRNVGRPNPWPPNLVFFVFPQIFSWITISWNNRNRNRGYQFQNNRITTATAVFWKLTTDPSLVRGTRNTILCIYIYLYIHITYTHRNTFIPVSQVQVSRYIELNCRRKEFNVRSISLCKALSFVIIMPSYLIVFSSLRIFPKINTLHWYSAFLQCLNISETDFGVQI